ncbi:protein brother isoform X1 [Drosophila miranda]|uniref:protein brother isoform X1 n=1 Tax=Drosophila miranda TaxID=7229 RepID=UPI0007E6B3B4|nr:protein brother isoform X1 [Drosophila miranda]
MHHHQNLGDAAAMPGMLPPYEAMAMYEQPKPRFIFKMPRVVPDQKSKYDSDELFRRLCRETEVRYTGYRERAIDERRMRFVNDCRKGYAELSFVTSGTNVQLYFNANHNPYAQDQECDFERERGKVHLRSHFIMNGVCVRFRGWVDLDRLDGVATLEFDEGRALQEDVQLREQIESYNQRMNESKRIYPVPHTPPEDHIRRGGPGLCRSYCVGVAGVFGLNYDSFPTNHHQCHCHHPTSQPPKHTVQLPFSLLLLLLLLLRGRIASPYYLRAPTEHGAVCTSIWDPSELRPPTPSRGARAPHTCCPVPLVNNIYSGYIPI